MPWAATGQAQWQQSAQQLAANGQRDQAIALVQHHLEQVKSTQDPLQIAQASHELGALLLDDGQFQQAEAVLAQAVEHYRQTDDDTATAQAIAQWGVALRQQARYPEALAKYEQSLQLFQKLEHLSGMGDRYNNIGVVLELMGQYGAALEAHEQSLAIARQVQDLGSVSSALYNIGEIWRDLGELDTARRYFVDSLEIDTRLENRNDMAYSHHKLGVVMLALGDVPSARTHLQRSEALFELAGNQRNVIWSRAVRGKIEMQAGNIEQAEPLLLQAATDALDTQSPTLRIEIGSYLTELNLKKGLYAQALDNAEHYIALAREVEETNKLAALLEMKTQALAALGRYPRALESSREQLALERDLVERSRNASNVLTRSRVELNRQQQLIELLEKDNAFQRAQFQRDEIKRTVTIAGIVLGLFLIAVYLHVRWQRRTNERLAIEIAARTEQLKHKNQALKKASITDPLTGLGNRRMIEGAFRQYNDQMKASSWTLFLLDLDHFKRVNDRYGHAAGDAILVGLNPCLKQVFGPSALCSRWGGEEFLVVCRSSQIEPDRLAEKLRACVEASRFETPAGTLSVTVSIGFATHPLSPELKGSEHWYHALDVADACLYAAKLSARNAWVGVGSTQRALNGSALRDALPVTLQQLEARGAIKVFKSFAQPTRWH